MLLDSAVATARPQAVVEEEKLLASTPVPLPDAPGRVTPTPAPETIDIIIDEEAMGDLAERYIEATPTPSPAPIIIDDGEMLEEDYFPEPVLADGTRITIENDDDLPLDVTVTFHSPATSSSQMLRVAPADGSDGALLFSQPDESSTPLGKCLTGIEVMQIAPAKDGFTLVHVQGYEGYMRSQDLEEVSACAIL